ncbi:hypothetical protein HK101_001118 [Irineochytrium annulatum]|nr:hypothetical protein HK101_001118 [Irineochytrium annulatum]
MADIDPNESFAGQLKILAGMGFSDTDKNRLALQRSGGKLQQSIDWIVTDSIPEHGAEDESLFNLAPMPAARRAGLKELKSMGFTDLEANEQALREARDDVDKAVVLLMQAMNGGTAQPDASSPASSSKQKGGIRLRSSKKQMKAAAPQGDSTSRALADLLGNAPVWGQEGGRDSTSGGGVTISTPSDAGWDGRDSRGDGRPSSSVARSLSPSYQSSLLPERGGGGSLNPQRTASRSLSPSVSRQSPSVSRQSSSVSLRTVTNGPGSSTSGSPTPSRASTAVNRSVRESQAQPPQQTQQLHGGFLDLDQLRRANLIPEFGDGAQPAQNNFLDLKDLQMSGLLPSYKDNYLYSKSIPPLVPLPSQGLDSSSSTVGATQMMAGLSVGGTGADLRPRSSAAEETVVAEPVTGKAEYDPFGDENEVAENPF